MLQKKGSMLILKPSINFPSDAMMMSNRRRFDKPFLVVFGLHYQVCEQKRGTYK